MKHTIDVAGIGGINKKIDLAGHFDQTTQKELLLEVRVRHNGEVLTTFVVMNNREVILSTENIYAAIKRYNSI
jgi:hypothetical protein